MQIKRNGKIIFLPQLKNSQRKIIPIGLRSIAECGQLILDYFLGSRSRNYRIYSQCQKQNTKPNPYLSLLVCFDLAKASCWIIVTSSAPRDEFQWIDATLADFGFVDV